MAAMILTLKIWAICSYSKIQVKIKVMYVLYRMYVWSWIVIIIRVRKQRKVRINLGCNNFHYISLWFTTSIIVKSLNYEYLLPCSFLPKVSDVFMSTWCFYQTTKHLQGDKEMIKLIAEKEAYNKCFHPDNNENRAIWQLKVKFQAICLTIDG